MYVLRDLGTIPRRELEDFKSLNEKQLLRHLKVCLLCLYVCMYVCMYVGSMYYIVMPCHVGACFYLHVRMYVCMYVCIGSERSVEEVL